MILYLRFYLLLWGMLLAALFSFASKKRSCCLEKKILEGFKAGKNQVEVAIIQYADDTIIFCPGDGLLLRKWWEISNVFCVGLGLSLNVAKTTNVGINVAHEVLNGWAAEFLCKIESFPFNYLGFPLGSNHNWVAFWDPLIDKIKPKLDFWRCMTLFKGGRVTLA